MIRMSWMSSLCRWVLFLPGLWPTKAGYCFVSAKKGQKMSLGNSHLYQIGICKVYVIVFNQVACGFVVSPKLLAGPWIAGYKCFLYNEISLLLVVLDESTRFDHSLSRCMRGWLALLLALLAWSLLGPRREGRGRTERKNRENNVCIFTACNSV